MERRVGRSDVGPIVAADQRTSTDWMMLIFLLVYLIFWSFVGSFVYTESNKLGLADPEDDIYIEYDYPELNMHESIKQIISFENKDRTLQGAMKLRLKNFSNKLPKTNRIAIFILILLIIVIVILMVITSYIAMVVFYSIMGLYLIKFLPRIALGISIFFFYFSMIYDVLDSFLKLLSALKLHHPNPIDHVAFFAYDLGCFLLVIFVTILFFKKLAVVAAVISEGIKAVMSFSCLIFFVPIAELLFVLILEVVFGFVAYSALLAKELKKNEFTGHIWFCQLYNLFGYFWLKSLISAAGRIIISRTVAIYYWSDSTVKHLMPDFTWEQQRLDRVSQL